MPIKDGNPRQTSSDAARPRRMRRLIGTLTIAGIGTFLAACGLALFPPRKRRITPGISGTDTCLQQLTRSRAADGTHSIRGTLLAEFEPGDRSTTLHVAFCPPFERLPAVEAEAVDDSLATVKLTQILHNGIQIDVRLPQPAVEKQSVTIEFVATDAAT